MTIHTTVGRENFEKPLALIGKELKKGVPLSCNKRVLL